MGSLSTQSYGLIAGAAIYSVVGLGWLVAHAHDLNLLTAGEEGAQQLGVEVERTRRAVFVASSLLVGAAVSMSGMIGFVGLIVPHLLRLLLGPDHRLLLPRRSSAARRSSCGRTRWRGPSSRPRSCRSAS
jgi:iron complex transport system permease protein